MKVCSVAACTYIRTYIYKAIWRYKSLLANRIWFIYFCHGAYSAQNCMRMMPSIIIITIIIYEIYGNIMYSATENILFASWESATLIAFLAMVIWAHIYLYVCVTAIATRLHLPTEVWSQMYLPLSSLLLLWSVILYHRQKRKKSSALPNNLWSVSTWDYIIIIYHISSFIASMK